MPAKLIVRIHPDDRVEVKVEGMTDRDKSRPKRSKLCEKVTKQLEQDLGFVTSREYAAEGIVQSAIELSDKERVKLGG